MSLKTAFDPDTESGRVLGRRFLRAVLRSSPLGDQLGSDPWARPVMEGVENDNLVAHDTDGRPLAFISVLADRLAPGRGRGDLVARLDRLDRLADRAAGQVCIPRPIPLSPDGPLAPWATVMSGTEPGSDRWPAALRDAVVCGFEYVPGRTGAVIAADDAQARQLGRVHGRVLTVTAGLEPDGRAQDGNPYRRTLREFVALVGPPGREDRLRFTRRARQHQALSRVETDRAALWRASAEEFAVLAAHLEDRGVRRRIHRRLACVAGLPPAAFRWQWVHGDLHPGNYAWDDPRGDPVVYDWNQAARLARVIDVASTLSGACRREGRFDPASAGCYLEGLAAGLGESGGRPIDGDEHAALHDLVWVQEYLRVRHIALLGAAQHRFAVPPAVSNFRDWWDHYETLGWRA